MDFQTYCEANNRRDFLKKLGMATSIALNPSGVASTLKKFVSSDTLLVDVVFSRFLRNFTATQGDDSTAVSPEVSELLKHAVPVIDTSTGTMALLDDKGNNISNIFFDRSSPIADELVEIYNEYLASIGSAVHDVHGIDINDLFGTLINNYTDGLNAPYSQLSSTPQQLSKAYKLSTELNTAISNAFNACIPEDIEDGIESILSNDPAALQRFYDSPYEIGEEISDRITNKILDVLQKRPDFSISKQIKQLNDIPSKILAREINLEASKFKKSPSNSKNPYQHIEPPSAPMLTPESYIIEADNRRDFLKKMGTGLAGSMMPVSPTKGVAKVVTTLFGKSLDTLFMNSDLGDLITDQLDALEYEGNPVSKDISDWINSCYQSSIVYDTSTRTYGFFNPDGSNALKGAPAGTDSVIEDFLDNIYMEIRETPADLIYYFNTIPDKFTSKLNVTDNISTNTLELLRKRENHITDCLKYVYDVVEDLSRSNIISPREISDTVNHLDDITSFKDMSNTVNILRNKATRAYDIAFKEDSKNPDSKKQYQHIEPPQAPMLSPESYVMEAGNRRDFLKKIGTGLAGSMMPVSPAKVATTLFGKSLDNLFMNSDIFGWMLERLDSDDLEDHIVDWIDNHPEPSLVYDTSTDTYGFFNSDGTNALKDVPSEIRDFLDSRLDEALSEALDMHIDMDDISFNILPWKFTTHINVTDDIPSNILKMLAKRESHIVGELSYVFDLIEDLGNDGILTPPEIDTELQKLCDIKSFTELSDKASKLHNMAVKINNRMYSTDTEKTLSTSKKPYHHIEPPQVPMLTPESLNRFGWINRFEKF